MPLRRCGSCIPSGVIYDGYVKQILARRLGQPETNRSGIALRVAFDSSVLTSHGRHQGIYVYAQNLIAQFKKIAAVRSDITFCLFASSQAANDANAVEPGNGFELYQTSLLAKERLWRIGGASVAAARAHADVIFAPSFGILPLGAVPVVCTIHDVTPVRMPSQSRKVRLLLRSFMWSGTRFSRAIITDSECSKRDLVNIYGLPESKVSVVYLGYDATIFNADSPDPERRQNLLTKLGIGKAYILHHGVLQPRKNLVRLIESYRLMLSRNRNLELDLVLAGRLGWKYEGILAAIGNGDGQRGRVILPGALPDSDLAMLVKGASLAVIPSLYEGFCLPMVESMACGVPTIAANSSCLPEISGGVLRYFDPESVDEMAVGMEEALENAGLRRELAEKGRFRAGQFDWRRCAEQTLAILAREAGAARGLKAD